MKPTIEAQLTALEARPSGRAIFRNPKVAQGNPYLRGEYMDHLANEIFGPQNVSTQVLTFQRDGDLVIAHVRVNLAWADDTASMREDLGAAIYNAPKTETAYAIAQAWEMTYKSAVTDARKNVLRSLGFAFGLDLKADMIRPKTTDGKHSEALAVVTGNNNGQEPAMATATASAPSAAQPANGQAPANGQRQPAPTITDSTMFWTTYNQHGLPAGVAKPAAGALTAGIAKTDAAAWTAAGARLWELILEAGSKAHS